MKKAQKMSWGSCSACECDKVCFQEFADNPSLKQIMLVNVAKLDTRQEEQIDLSRLFDVV